MRIFAILFTLVFIPTEAQYSISQSNVPAWVTPYEYNSKFADTTETSDGYAYLLISKQSNVETKEYYSEFVTKVTSEKGLSEVSSINEYFDPSYQQLTFHKLNIIRDGKKINKLSPAKFDVIRREDQLERAVYDKGVNAIYNLPDVRVGDIIEYSLTRKGFNPIFKDHRFGMSYMQYGIPVGKFAYRILYSPNRKLQFKTFGDIGTEAVEKTGKLNSIEWNRENVPAILTDDRYPTWYDPFPRFQYTDFQSWNELKQWAIDLYTIPTLSTGELKGIIDGIRSSGKTDEAKIKACIRVAQGDIRYLSFSDGINGYKPHPPEDVYIQKYGDCKDKSFMLATMLNALGYKSFPALVSTDTGYSLGEVLPNPWAFNHCIVQFMYNDSTYWIDPTMNAQVGPLKSYSFPSYHNALVINNDQNSLSPIPYGYKNSVIDIREEYSMIEVGGYVYLKVNTTYYGDEADDIRSYFTSNTTSQVGKDFLNFYAKDFMDISSIKDFEYNDDTDNNIIKASEEYLIKDFWKTENEKKTANVYASFLASYLKKPDTRIRTMPLAVSHPHDIRQTITIKLPEEFDIKDSFNSVESEAFEYSRSKNYDDKTITLKYQYKSKASFVSTEQVMDHIENISRALDDNGLNIYKPLNAETTNTKNPYLALIVILFIGGYFIWNKYFK